jgi:putative phosphohydrolase, metallophosphoesterase
MKVFAISDLHLCTTSEKPMDIFGTAWENYFEKIVADWKQKVAAEDLVLLPGDFSWAMNLSQAVEDFELIRYLPGSKVLIRGNHDYWWSSLSKLRSALPEGIYAVQNDCLRFGKILVCGSRGWVCPDNTPLGEEDQKIYLREIERLKLSFARMQSMRQPEDKVICMMHFPPFNVRRADNPFTDLIRDHRIDAVVYGHLHGKDCRADLKYFKNGIWYYLTSCDLVANQLTEIV